MPNIRTKCMVLCLFLAFSLRLPGEDFFKIKKEVVEGSWKRIGFLYVAPTFTLENMGYTSNIYSYQDQEEPDWTADLGIDARVSSILGERLILSLQENPYYSFYADNVDERAWSNRLKASLYTYFGRFNLKYEFAHNNIKSSPTPELGARIRTIHSQHHVSLDYGKHKNFFINLYWQQGQVDYAEEDYLGEYNLKESLSRMETRAGINIYKRVFTRTRLFLNYEYYEHRFDYAGDRDGIGNQVSLGIEFPEIGRIKGSMRFGLKISNPSNVLFRDTTRPFGEGEVAVSLLKRFKVHLQYKVDNAYSFWRQDQEYKERSLEAGVEYYLARRIKVGYKYHVGTLSYENLVDGGTEREDRMYISRLSIGFRVFSDMGIGLEYQAYRVESDVPGFGRSVNFVGGYFIHEF